ncbi:MAG TPA: adenylate/guanylate cyclase domain-containing protein [Chloroflexota bacterium]|nr:adenylate/guanylate cyclase domain-containing protein [Chloroflexota bacterium]
MNARERKRFLICIGLSLAVGLLLSGSFLTRLNPYPELTVLQNIFVDTVSFKGRDGKAEKVVLAQIDEKSVSSFRTQYGRPFSWPRTIHAQVLRNLADAGARVIAYDMLFDAPGCRAADGPVCQEDNDFAAAIDYAKTAKPGVAAAGSSVIFAIAGEHAQVVNPGDALTFTESIPPIQALASRANALAHIHPFPDGDGIVRRMPLVAQIKGQEYPALAFQAAASYLRRPQAVEQKAPGTIVSSGRPIPVDPNWMAIINYQGQPSHVPGKPGPVPVLSYVDLYNNSFDKNLVKDKIVFVGLTAIGFADDWQAPTSNAETGKMSGVEVHAQTAEMILRGAYLQLQDPASTVFLIMLLSVIPGIIMARFQPVLAAGVSAGLLLLYIVGAAIYLTGSVNSLDTAQTFLLLNFAYPGAALLVTFVVVMLYRIVIEQAEQRATKGVMGKYLSPAVMHEVLKDPDGLKLGGEKREMSVLFSDIRGFTSVSEKMDPQELVHFLNEYLTEMTNIVFEHQGVLDKYMGDAIMAFWGAPTHQPDHAEQACRTAFHMMRRLRELQPGWSERGLPPLNIGVGVNTGFMTAGNVGSKMRFDYTVMGDSVNLGSRLEGVNKEYGTNIIISDGTYQHIQDKFAVRFLDLIAVKGKKEPTAIYELIAPLDVAAAQPKPGFLDTWEIAIGHYKAQRFDDAKAAFERVLAISPDDGPALAYLERCDEMAAAPPGVEWDGVFVMTHK